MFLFMTRKKFNQILELSRWEEKSLKAHCSVEIEMQIRQIMKDGKIDDEMIEVMFNDFIRIHVQKYDKKWLFNQILDAIFKGNGDEYLQVNVLSEHFIDQVVERINKKQLGK